MKFSFLLQYMLPGLAIVLFIFLTDASAQDRNGDPQQLQNQQQVRERVEEQDRQIYGWQLMTPLERAQYHDRMRKLQTEQERETYRSEHHALMQERARERGMILPDMELPAGDQVQRRYGSGMGPGMGNGPGMMGGGPGMRGGKR